jgi:hypothetical protein
MPKKPSRSHPRLRTPRSANNQSRSRPEALPGSGKAAGELRETKAARFPFGAQCRARGSSTDAVNLEAVAMKRWNEAKREGKARALRK